MVSVPLVMVLGPSAEELAHKIAASVGGEIAKRGEGFTSTTDLVQDAFHAGRPIIGICAAGILIRTLGPVIADKRSEPPVVAVAEDGSSIVPLLGGHHGANELARQIAAETGGHAAITTAGDRRFGIALDEPPEGYVLANPLDAKAVTSALLAGASAKVSGVCEWLANSDLPIGDNGEVELCVTHENVSGNEKRLVYHPKTLILGVGSSRGCPADEMIALVDDVLRENNISPHALACIATIDVKADEAAMHALADHLSVPLRLFSADVLNNQAPRLANPSSVVLAEVGCPGVAEGAALAGGGIASSLLVEKTKSANATCAISLAVERLNFLEIGRARGRVSVIGIGPGQEEWRSGEAAHLLRAASDWVGYGLYLDIVKELSSGKTQHRFDLGEEEARVRHALELAGEGRDVALVCSGDAGIYAMAALVFELLDERSDEGRVSDAAQRVEIVVAPGISAFQAAAARAGAPIGHDFCAISLSDLLTPWEVIEKRLKAAAQGDFVVAFYNPKSMRRTDQIVKAMEILGHHRPLETPIILASSLGRPKENIKLTTLGAFDADDVDMLTLVMVGSSTSRTVKTGDGREWVYTPRGYEKKRNTNL